MPRYLFSPFIPVLTTALIFSPRVYPQKSLDVNLGTSPSKSVLGLSYTEDRNQVNIGLRGFGYSSTEGFFIEPGLAYNRYFTRNGFYGTAIYTFRYLDVKERQVKFTNGNPYLETNHRKGWESGFAMTGLGKSFQFTRWGLHADVGLVTPATADFIRAWGWWLGAGASYRFKLD